MLGMMRVNGEFKVEKKINEYKFFNVKIKMRKNYNNINIVKFLEIVYIFINVLCFLNKFLLVFYLFK